MNFSIKHRILALFFAIVVLITATPVMNIATPIFAESLLEQVNGEQAYEDSLIITLDGEETYSLDLPENEKYVIRAEGAPEDATYQWQILHKDYADTWVNIYDAKSDSLALTAALVTNMLNSAAYTEVRCRAYTEDSAYLSPSFAITLCPAILVDTTTVVEAKEELNTESVSQMQRKARSAVAAAAETIAFVTVTVEYIRYDYVTQEDGTMVLEQTGEAFNPYIATLQAGTAFYTTVENPTIVGYDAWYQDEKTTKVELAFDAVTENQKVTIEYRPADVAYEVRYYFQNIYDDFYVEDVLKKQNLTGPTGSRPDSASIQKEFEGFTSLYYQPELIAADGSTVFECYYERNYYLMNFDCNGGYGTDTIYVRCDTYVSVPDPTRTGYVFQGWDLVEGVDFDGDSVTVGDNEEDVLPSSMPKYNSSYRAIWETEETQYTIAYWKADLSDGSSETTYSYWGMKSVKEISGTSLTPSAVGTDHPARNAGFNDTEARYFTYNAEKTAEENAPTVTVEGDGSTVINVYYSRKKYTIRFVYARKENTEGSQFQVSNSTGCGSYNGIVGKSGHGHYIDWSQGGYGTFNTLPVIDGGFTSSSFIDDDYIYYYISLTAEYGANIEAMWPAAAVGSIQNGNGTFPFGSWAAQCGSGYRETVGGDHANIVGKYPVMSAEMIVDPDDSIAQTMVAWWARSTHNVDKHLYHIYYEALPGETDGIIEEYGKRKYKLDRDLVFTAAHNGNTRVDPFYYNGFTILESEKGGDGNSSDNTGHDHTGSANADVKYCNTYHYTRNRYTLSFYNYNEESGKPADVERMYEQPIKGAKPDNDPEYPKGLEPGAYVFGGWYTSPGCFDGSEVEWDSMTMPAGDMKVYAKWTPIKRKVTFYALYTDVGVNEAYMQIPEGVDHGTVLGTAYTQIPTREGYSFVGWFYMEEGNKKKFAPDTMKVVKDLDLFAEWQSSMVTQYKVEYVFKEPDESTEVTIAEATAGYSTAGKTKTFMAKGGTELLAEYQNQYFPTSNSHSILMDPNPTNNTYTFYYVKKDKIQYKVRYIDKITGVELAESEVKQTEKAVVTEKFKAIHDYIPESYYIRKTIAYDPTDYEDDSNHVEEANVITFYYIADAKHGMFSIEYYLENVDSTGATDPNNYTLIQSEIGIADIDSEKEAMIYSFEGFDENKTLHSVTSYDDGGKATTVIGSTSGKVSQYGLEIKVYYQRKPYPYKIQYVEYGNSNNVLYTLNGNEKFEKEVSHVAPAQYTDAKNGVNYSYYIKNSTEKDRTKSIVIREETNANVITFYYEAIKIDVFYRAVCTVPGLTNFGGVSLNYEAVAGSTAKAGSTATPGTGYAFLGWFSDENCTNQISGDNELVPKDISESNCEFYALFAPIESNLHLTKAGVAEADSNHNFLFAIVGKAGTSNAHVQLMVAITGNGSISIAHLPIGEYTVTELDDWSWEYTPESQSQKITVVENATAALTFDNVCNESCWLSGESSENNKFDAVLSGEEATDAS